MTPKPRLTPRRTRLPAVERRRSLLGAVILTLLAASAARSVTVAPGGRLYIADTFNHRIVSVHDISGGGWTSVGSQGQGPRHLSYPRAVAVDPRGRV